MSAADLLADPEVQAVVQAQVAAALAAADAVRAGQRLNPTIAQIYAWYWANCAAREIASPASVRWQSKRILERFGALAIDDFNADVEDRMLLYAHSRRADGVKNSTIRREISILSAAIRHAAKKKRIDPAQVLWLPKPPPGDPRERVLDHEGGGELDRFIAALDHEATPFHYRTFALLSLMTAQRKTTVLDLRRPHIDIYDEPRTLRGGEISYGLVRFSKTQARKTKKKRQDQPIHAALLPVIQEALAHTAPGCDYLVQRRGRRVKDVRAAHKAVLARAGIAHCTIHDLRRTVAQTVRDETDDLAGTAGLLGNTPAQTDTTYARAKVERNLKPMGVMAAILARAGAPARSGV